MKVFLIIGIIFVAILDNQRLVSGDEPQWNYTFTDQLKKDLLSNYDKYARPEHHAKATFVNVSISLRHFDVDEVKSVLTTHVWFRMQWTDSKLKWNPEKYGNQSLLHVGDHEVWQPDLTLYNSASGSAIDYYGNTHCLVYSTGSVLWVPPTKFDSFCQLDLKYWPFDTQKCEIVIGSWTYSGFQINLTVANEPIEFVGVIQNSEWKVVNYSAETHKKYYECCPEPYHDVTFTIVIERNSPMYKAIVVTPSILVIFMILLTFWLPPQAGEKILLNGISCIIICILLMYFSQLLPVLAMSTPLIVRFYSSTLYLISFSFVVSVIVINFSRNRKPYGVNKYIKDNVINSKIGAIFGSSLTFVGQQQKGTNKTEEEDGPATNEMQSFSEDNKLIDNQQNDWIVLAVIIDRIAFLIYLIIFIICGLFHCF
jgi:hypothetical protein